ncbi:hypothetical protein HAX54_038540 [Datura stramonium]|uniref:TF-B3 domain-containing protein n=1 Tax=Datura stramonium TaxID=4076 RepID=A0ABS8VLA3_DATST|nr:hypothetical protein [Datura stramonium]
MECVNEACDRCEKDCGLLIHGKRVVSFFKVMMNERCLEVLGWPEFLSEHGVGVGNFLVFHYVPADKRFSVQIFEASACEKINFCSAINKGKQPETSNQVTYKPNIADTVKGRLVHSPIYMDELLCMIDRDAQYDQDDGRLCLHLSSFEMPKVKPLTEGTNNPFKGDNANETNLGSLTEPLLPKFETRITTNYDTVRKPAEDIPLLGPKDEKIKEASQFGEEYANNSGKVIRNEPANSEDSSSLNAVN